MQTQEKFEEYLQLQGICYAYLIKKIAKSHILSETR